MLIIRTDCYLGLSLTAPDVSGNNVSEPPTESGYDRVHLDNMVDLGAFTMANGTDINFNECTSDWGVISHITIHDSGERGAGNMLLSFQIPMRRRVETGTIMCFKPGALRVQHPGLYESDKENDRNLKHFTFGAFSEEQANKVIKTLSTHPDATIECATEEEGRQCLEFLRTAGRKWIDGEPYSELSLQCDYTDKVYHRFNTGLYSGEQTSYSLAVNEQAKAANAYYQWPEIADLLVGTHEATTPSDEEVQAFLLGD